jgi:hypothetical protein
MTSPLPPILSFVALVVSAAVAIPLASVDPALAMVGIAGFMTSLGMLAFMVLRADRAADPRRGLIQAVDRFDKRWPRFERDFWAHVAALAQSDSPHRG